MRWLIILMSCCAVTPALAVDWQYGAALSNEDRVSGALDTRLTRHLPDGGRFSAKSIGDDDALKSWSWFGKWAPIDCKIAMIGPKYASWDHAVLYKLTSQSSDVRGCTALVQEDVSVLNMTENNRHHTFYCYLRETV